jgi:hypothetical protein
VDKRAKGEEIVVLFKKYKYKTYSKGLNISILLLLKIYFYFESKKLRILASHILLYGALHFK